MTFMSVSEQRKLAEREAGEPCFRMWLTKEEWKTISFADWTAYPIDNDHVAIWRKKSYVTALLAATDPAIRDLGMLIGSRELPDN